MNNPFELPPIQVGSVQEAEVILRELADNFRKTEDKVTEIQDALNATAVPSLNQLRYAGYHLSQVITRSNLSSTPLMLDQGHLVSSYRHCLRAYYDVFDFAVIIIVEAFRNVVADYGAALIPIEQHFPKYPLWTVEIRQLSKLKKLAEENELYERARDRSKREQYYEILDKKIVVAFEVFEHIPLMAEKLSFLIRTGEKERETHLLQLAEERRRTQLAEQNAVQADNRTAQAVRWTKISVAITTLAVVVAVLVVIFDKPLKELGDKMATPLPKQNMPPK